ncbi:hypothetical protein YA0089_26830 [Pseudomonas viridiflava]|uniref:hypothetical protein n=1 Tax=Pseudomonas viridiflava TaxID=33069 RepID=UPI0018E62ADE|nr:hypothetical protein [Pseudomonas viridiflava]MBI6727234.1 hypothetical protein [Pseudomonas viridiflava]
MYKAEAHAIRNDKYRLCRTPVQDCPSEGPYTGVTSIGDRDFGTHGKFRVMIYAAFNAMGLIGPEMNGVAVAQELDKFDVIFDGGAQTDSGYFGASATQLQLFDDLMAADWEQFRTLVNQQKRLRAPI